MVEYLSDTEYPQGRRILVVFAHPDDAEYAAAGAVARWAAEGRDVFYLAVTDGSKGTADRCIDPAAVAERRAAEQRAAARVLGARDVFFLGFEDGVLQATIELRREIVRVIRRVRPDVVCCPDPTARLVLALHRRYLRPNHPDHIAVGDATLAAVYPSARDHLFARELLANGLEPHRVGEVLLWGTEQPTLFVDVGGTIERKIAALECHASQDRPEPLAEVIRERARRVGEAVGLAYAEAFGYVVTR